MRSVDGQRNWIDLGYIALAAFSGALTALGFVKWRDMTWGEIGVTFFAGFSFAIFVTPWMAHELMGIAENNTRAIAALTYINGAGSNLILPWLIRHLKRTLGLGDVR